MIDFAADRTLQCDREISVYGILRIVFAGKAAPKNGGALPLVLI